MDIDAFIAVQSPHWQRLDALVRARTLDAAQIDELVQLYQRTTTDLSLVRSRTPDARLQAHLSMLLHRARLRITGTRASLWSSVKDFLWSDLPAALYRAGGTIAAAAGLFVLVAVITGVVVSLNEGARDALIPPAEQRLLVTHDFVEYYSQGTAIGFSASVWSNNAWIAVQSVVFGVTGFWPVRMILLNAMNLGATGGVMAAHGALGTFFLFISPHGLLEITAILIGAGAGLRLFWAWVRPGPLPRGWALASAARAMMTVGIGLVGILAVAGVLEAFVTPSALPPALRVGIGVLAWAALMAFILVRGRRAAAEGVTGDLSEEVVGDRVEVAA